MRGASLPSFYLSICQSWHLWQGIAEMVKRRIAYFFIAPAVIATVLLVFYPLVNGVYLSFTNADKFNSAKVIGGKFTPHSYELQCGIDSNKDDLVSPASCLRNYINIFQDERYYFWQVFGQTLIWTVANIVPHILLGLGLALLLNRNIRYRAFYRVALILPWAVPSYISAFVWKFLYNSEYGFINNFFGTNINWFADPTSAMIAVVIANTWLAVPFNMVTMLGGLQSIPGDLYEAAEVDGANWRQKFTGITLPMLRPVMMTAVLLGVIWTFNSFNVIFLVSQGAPSRQTEILATWAWRLGRDQEQYGISAAYSVIILLLLLFFSFVYIRVLSRPGQEDAL